MRQIKLSPTTDPLTDGYANEFVGGWSQRLTTPSIPRLRSSLRWPFVTAFVALVDALGFAFAHSLGVVIRFADYDALFTRENAVSRASIVAALMVMGLAIQGAYGMDRIRSGQELLRRLAAGLCVGLSLIVLATFVHPSFSIGRGVFVISAALAFPILIAWRYFAYRAIKRSVLRPRALVLGPVDLAQKVASVLSAAKYGGAEVVGILSLAGDPSPPPQPGLTAGEKQARIVGGYRDLAMVVPAESVTHAVVVRGEGDAHLPADQIAALSRRGLSILDGVEVYEALTGKIMIDKLTPGWFVFANAFERSAMERATRRLVEAVVAGLALVILSPILLATAVLVKLSSKGPVLFRQVRVGEGGAHFEVLKFRSMCEDAEASTGAVFAQRDDPRVTRFGRFMRRTRLDEFPQLWNVLRGDMNVVGPRPERPEFVERFRDRLRHYDLRHTVKPGITGWAQINHTYGSSLGDARTKLHYDLFYIQNMSLLLDFDIVVGTIRVMLGGRNQH